jgi:hypothetical protein
MIDRNSVDGGDGIAGNLNPNENDESHPPYCPNALGACLAKVPNVFVTSPCLVVVNVFVLAWFH